MLRETRGAHDARQKSFRRRSSSLPVYLYFTNRFQKERNTLGLSGTAQSARREGGGGEKKKTKKIIIKMSHRESPMSRKSERKKREKKKNSEILLKSGGNPPSTTLSPPVDPFSIPALRVQRYTSLGYLGRTARTQTSISIVFNARREDLSSPFLHGVPPFLG